MTTNNVTIWDKAKERALSRNSQKRKQNKHQKVEAVLSGPTKLIKFCLFVTSIYALYKYVPAYINFNHIISEATSQPSTQPGAQNLADSHKKWGIAKPLREYVKLKKAYMRDGQTLQVQYILPEQAQATLTIKRCKNLPIIELFNCEVVQAETIEIGGNTVGTQRLRVKGTAMYVLESQVIMADDERFDIVWRRT